LGQRLPEDDVSVAQMHWTMEAMDGDGNDYVGRHERESEPLMLPEQSLLVADH
jgi:hypothetical protein